MKFLRNFKITTKLLSLVVILVTAFSCINIFNVINIKNMAAQSMENQDKIINTMEISNASNKLFWDYSAVVSKLTRDDVTLKELEILKGEAVLSGEKFLSALNKYKDLFDHDTVANKTQLGYYNEMLDVYNNVKDLVEVFYQIEKSQNASQADISKAESEFFNYQILASNKLTAMLDNSEYYEHLKVISIDNASNSIYITVGLGVFVTIFGILVAGILSKSISLPIIDLKRASKEIVAGNLDIVIGTNYTDEVGEISRDYQNVIDTINELITDIEDMERERALGNVNVFIDPSKYNGSYNKLAEKVLKLISVSNNDMQIVVGILSQFAEGNFEVEVPRFPGQKGRLNTKLDIVMGNLNGVTGEILGLVESAKKGDLSARTNSTGYSGEWFVLLDSLNQLLDSLLEPITDSLSVLYQISQGDLSVRVSREYLGDHGNIKNVVNQMADNLSDYVMEISSSLKQISGKDLTGKVDSVFIGDFADIKESINLIIHTLNETLGEIQTLANRVSENTLEISSSSNHLSGGAQAQTADIKEIGANLEEFRIKTVENRDNSATSYHLSEKIKEYAGAGNKKMNEMLKSMNEINSSSESIFNIISVIEDISLQTNLLALNANVEAARAGEAGKGFAVVAEEVRSLANKSKLAAEESKALIEGSVKKIKTGTQIAKSTDESLIEISRQVSEITDLIHNVMDVSNDQVEAITSIYKSLQAVSDVTMQTSSTLEEQAAATSILSELTDAFRKRLDEFEINKHKR